MFISGKSFIVFLRYKRKRLREGQLKTISDFYYSFL